MKKLSVLVVVIGIFSLIFPIEPFAQSGMKGSGGWGPKSKYNRMYDPKTVETLSGEVVSVDKITR